MATAVEVSRDNEELVYSASDDYSSSSDEGDERVGLRSAVVVQRNSPPAKRPRRDHSPVASGPQWVEKPTAAAAPKKELDPILTRTGGAYIPPARLRMMRDQISDKSSVAYQRMSWEALKKSINGLINKVNIANIGHIVQEILQENIVRGRGLLARSIITAQVSSPTFTHVYAALVAIINTKFPQIGELIAKRLIQQFRRAFRRNDKNTCLSSVRFVAHLVNQQVTHELLALELLTVLLEDPSSDSVEVAVGFLKECGQKLTELSPRGVHGVFESLKGILHDGNVDVRVQYMIEVMFAIRKDGFKEHPAIVGGLDVVGEEDQITHLLSLEDDIEGEERLNVFQADPDFLENEEKYRQIKAEMLGGDSDAEASSGDEEDDEDDDDDDDEEEEEEEEGVTIEDMTETNLLALRRTVYLTIMSSLDFEECAHKILKMNIKPGQEVEVAYMIIECCSQERSYQRFYGLLGERFCHLNQLWVEKFDAAFVQQYTTVHRLETNKLRNVAKFFAQLFYTDALPWTCMACVRLNEDETTSSSRIFIKILFQELAEYMGLPKLNERLKDPFLSTAFEGLMPRDNPRNTRFAINFFTSIGLGGLTDDLREHLKNAPKLIMAQHQTVESDTSSDSDDESSSDSDSSSSSSDSSSSSEEERRKKRRKDRARKREREERENKRPDRQRPSKDEKSHREEHRSHRGEERSGRKKRDDRTDDHRRHRSRSPPSHKSRHHSRSPPSRHRSKSPPSRHRSRSPPSHKSRHHSRSPPSRHRSKSPPSRHHSRSPPSHKRSPRRSSHRHRRS